MTAGLSRTVPRIVDDLRRYGAAPALAGIDAAPLLSHAGLAVSVQRMAADLARAGIGRGDVVMMAATDGPAAMLATLAIASVATALPVPALDQDTEYERLLDAVDVRAVLLDDRPDAAIGRIAARHCLTTVRMAMAGNGGAPQLTIERPRPARPVEPPAPEDHAVIGLTSGTTAAPKVVAVSHASVAAQSRRFGQLMGLTGQDRSLCVMPVSHLHSLFRSSLPVLMQGGSVRWAPGLDDRRALAWIDTLGPTFLTGTPTHLRRLAARAESTGWTPARSRLRLIALGSDRVTEADLDRVRTVFGAQVVQFYGMTETSPTIAATPLTGTVPPGAAGLINPDWDVDCLDQNGHPVPHGEVGEIAVRGGFINPVIGRTGADRTRLDTAGRFLTGDLGRIDAAGFLHVVGRVDERITRGGEKIAPQTVEDAILGMAAVAGAVAFGVPDPVLGERVALAVQPVPGSTVTEMAILEYLSTRVPHHVLPGRVILADRLPDTRVGKISRRSLASRFADALSAPETRRDVDPAPANIGSGMAAEMLEIFRRRLAAPDLGPDDDFSVAGGDSLTALEILMEIEERLGVSLAPAAFTVAGTAAKVAAAVGQARCQPSGARVIETRSGDGCGPVVVVAHGLGGEAAYAPNLARVLPDRLTVAALHARDADIGHAGPKTLPELAEGYAALLCETYPGRSFVLGGFSLGAHVALAVANRLVALRRAAPLVFVLDDEADLDRREFGARRSPTSERTPEAMNKWALDASPAEPFSGHIAYFRAEENAAIYRSDPTAGWGEIALGGVTIADVPGNHHDVIRMAAFERIGPALRQAIDRAAGPGTRPPPADQARRLRYEARLAAREGRLDDEIARSRQLIETIPDQPSWLHANTAEALFQRDDVPAALASMHRAVGCDPWPLTTDLRFAATMVRRGLKAEISAMLKRAKGVVPDHPSVTHQLGALNVRLGRSCQAEDYFRQGLARAPGHLKTSFGMAAAHFRAKRFVESARIHRSIAEAYPEIAFAHLSLGLSLLHARQPENAEEVLLGALERWPRHVRLTVALARAVRECGRSQDAEALCRRAIAVAPKAREPQDLLAEILHEAGRSDDLGTMAAR